MCVSLNFSYPISGASMDLILKNTNMMQLIMLAIKLTGMTPKQQIGCYSNMLATKYEDKQGISYYWVNRSIPNGYK